MKNILQLVKSFISIYPELEWFREFRRANKETIQSQGIRKQIWAFRKGFYLETINLCGITNENAHEYLSDRAYLEFHPINNEYSKIIDNKLFLPFLLKDYPEIVPKYFYLIEKGRLINIDSKLSDKNELLLICKERFSLAIKPYSSTMGEGFYKLEWKNDQFLLNSKPIEEPELISFIKTLDGYIITEYIGQNKYAAEINQSSVNTIRIICVRDTLTKKFFIQSSNHRFGVEGKFVDNMGAKGGGIAAYIDISTGKIKNIACIKENGKLIKINKVIKHPDSKKQVTGLIIPNWSRTIEKVLEVMNHLSFLKYVGLDIVITENEFKVIEINSLPTLLGIQFEEGILKDDRMRRFFSELTKQTNAYYENRK
ncbi:MAG TPA: sugar-transfer associated ATP-grasp domain-containing protein [Paludibacter sp.]|nr:sugar-transfer associated ATP-grasp domain-containing protein [Prolixibacteraceae bacterium]